MTPTLYDIVPIGPSLWSGTMTTLVRTYIFRRKALLKGVAFFRTSNSGSKGHTFEDMERLWKKIPLALLEIEAKMVSDGKCATRIEEFINEISQGAAQS